MRDSDLKEEQMRFLKSVSTTEGVSTLLRDWEG